MIEVAIVEDSQEEQQRLLQHLKRYAEDCKKAFQFSVYSDALSFLEEGKTFDIVFMDIMMPHITGMEAAMKLREYDKRAVLIFVTTMAQFAIKGYEVDALDYIVKPVSFERLTMKLRKAVEIIEANEGGKIIINHAGGLVKCPTGDILYVEVSGHKLEYHTVENVYVEYGSMRKLEETLSAYDFMRCNACYLVNPKHITQVRNRDLTILMSNGEVLKISQPRRKSFISELTDWLGQGNR